MTILLAGDIGGTKTILRLVNSNKLDSSSRIPQLTTLYEQTYKSQDFVDLVPMVRQFFQECADSLDEMLLPKKACFGIAGPVINNISELTNINWFLEGNRLEKDLNISEVKLINDFAAVGYGVLGLSKSDLHTLQDIKPEKHAPIAVIGAGTGLGEGFLLPLPDGNYLVFSSEGSHADFAPRSELEFELLTYIQKYCNLDRVSTERVVSGIGIVNIYQFLRQKNPAQESAKFTQLYQAWAQDNKNINLAAEISEAALNKSDILCQQTLQLFISAYGAEAGNFALKLLPYGGLYVAGGIATKILPLIQEGEFINAFQNKGRMKSLIKKIPIHIVLNPQVGLIGAALCAAT
jgi:glucokinase